MTTQSLTVKDGCRAGSTLREKAARAARSWHALGRAALDLVYPRRCAVCELEMRSDPGHLCWECRRAIPVIHPPFCRHCGDPIEGRVSGPFLCSLCRRRLPAFDSAHSAVRYRGPVRQALHALKYEHQAHLARDLAPWMRAALEVHMAGRLLDAVTCVPLHIKRERERTYNQSALLAAALARSAALPLAARCLRRVRPTPSQTGLMAAERRRNVRGAFAAAQHDWIEGRRFLLVDDVMTTGATVHECARTLKKAGATAVHVLTLARG